MLNGSSCSKFTSQKMPCFPYSVKTISARRVTFGVISILIAGIKGLFELLITNTVKDVWKVVSWQGVIYLERYTTELKMQALYHWHSFVG